MCHDADDDRVQCHLCGGWYRTVGGRHLLLGHGWTLEEYRRAFGLLERDPTCARRTSAKLRAHTTDRIRKGNLIAPTGNRKPVGSRGRGVRWAESLAVARPALMAEFDPVRNPGVDPYRLGVRSGRKLWWTCSGCGHTFSAAPHERSVGAGCSVCARRRRAEAAGRVPPQRSLEAKRPDLVAELHPTLNPRLDPATIGADACGASPPVGRRAASPPKWLT